MQVYINKKEITEKDKIKIGDWDYDLNMLLTAVRNYERLKEDARNRIRKNRAKAKQEILENKN